MSLVTTRIAKYVSDRGINITKISEMTGLEYGVIYDSLGPRGRGRDLRDDELIKICTFLEVNPMDFADSKEDQKGGDIRAKKGTNPFGIGEV